MPRVTLVLLRGGKDATLDPDPAPGDETFCDWCQTDPGPSGECDCPVVHNRV